MNRYVRHSVVLLIVLICVVATIRLFDWGTVLDALRHMRVRVLVGGGIPVLLAIFGLRGLRWLVVLGIAPTMKRFLQSFWANTVASGLASITPFQLGEVVKIKLIPDEHGSGWRLGASAVLAERTMDLSCVLGLGFCGLMLHFGLAWLSPLGLLLPLLASLILGGLSKHVDMLPARVRPYVEAFRNTRRIVLTCLLTIPIWLLYACLFWCAALAMNIVLSFAQITMLLGGVTLAVTASMVPGGLGVSELGTRGIMLWLGASTADADISAIALRMLTPLTLVTSFACVLALARYRRA